MTAVDTNILVYAHRADSPWHARAISRLTELAEGPNWWCVPWPCAHEFFSVVTNARLFKEPTAPEKALGMIDAWTRSPGFRFLSETSSHLEVFRKVALDSKISGAAIHDARIYAICLSHGVRTLWSADRDFSRFGGIDLVNPLREARV